MRGDGGPGLVAAPVLRSARKAAGMPAPAVTVPPPGSLLCGRPRSGWPPRPHRPARAVDQEGRGGCQGARSTSPLGRLGRWSARPQGTGLQALRFPSREPAGERKAIGAGARSAAPMAGGSGLDHPAGICALVHDQRLHESDPVSPDSSAINSPRLRVLWAVLSSCARSVWRAESPRDARATRPERASSHRAGRHVVAQ